MLTSISLISSVYGHPLSSYTNIPEANTEEPEIDYGSPEFYEKLVLIMGLVLLGGVFAGKKKKKHVVITIK
jgi:hypothetical protein